MISLPVVCIYYSYSFYKKGIPPLTSFIIIAGSHIYIYVCEIEKKLSKEYFKMYEIQPMLK